MPWGDFNQTKAAQPVADFGQSRGTGGGNPYARQPMAGDMGARSRFGVMAQPRPQMGGGMDGPKPAMLNMPRQPLPAGAAQGLGAAGAQMIGGAPGGPPPMVRPQMDPAQMAARRQALMARQAAAGGGGNAAMATGAPAGTAVPATGGAGLAGLAGRLPIA